MFRILMVLLFAALSAVQVDAAGVKVKFINEDRPSKPSSSGETYGLVKFKVARARSDVVNQRYWAATTQKLYGSTRDGNYILALEIKNADGTAVLAREVLAEYSVATSRKKNDDVGSVIASFLGFDTSSTETKQTSQSQWSGSIFSPGILIKNDNNNLRVVITLYYSNSQIFNGAFFSQLSKAAASLASVTVPVPGLTQVTDVISKVIDKNYTQRDIVSSSDSQGMSFILNGGQGAGFKELTYVASMDGRNDLGEFRVTIEFVTVPTLSGTKFDTTKLPKGQFENPSVDQPFSSLTIAGVALREALLQSTDDQTKVLFRYLDQPGSVADPKSQFVAVGSNCNSLISTLQKSFSSRDANLVYWAILMRYQPQFKQLANYTDCLPEFRRESLLQLGLPTSTLFAPQTLGVGSSGNAGGSPTPVSASGN